MIILGFHNRQLIRPSGKIRKILYVEAFRGFILQCWRAWILEFISMNRRYSVYMSVLTMQWGFQKESSRLTHSHRKPVLQLAFVTRYGVRSNYTEVNELFHSVSSVWIQCDFNHWFRMYLTWILLFYFNCF